MPLFNPWPSGEDDSSRADTLSLLPHTVIATGHQPRVMWITLEATTKWIVQACAAIALWTPFQTGG